MQVCEEVCWSILQVAGSAGRFSPFVSFSFCSTAVGRSRVLEHAVAVSVDSVFDQRNPGPRRQAFSAARRACLVVQR